jgi:glycosyltransferase involved in cell wall biosynthesis
MLNILFVHQSADMYGSDKVLLSLVEGLDRVRFRPVVMLPCEGPLKEALQEGGIEVHVVPLVRIGRSTLSLVGLARLPWEIGQSLRTMSRLLKGRKISIVHSNTLAVLSGALWAKWKRVPHIWHVHEMIVHPRLVREGFPILLRLFADRVACNSNATMQLLLDLQPSLKNRSVTIWNGMDRNTQPNGESARLFRQEMQLSTDEVLVVLMGRINRWKGQKLLVEAAKLVRCMGIQNVRYLIVGSAPPGQIHFLDELSDAIATSGVSEHISVMTFQEDIWHIWDAADIAVVPSTEPEPFGMVALEAMAAGKPVVAAAHGGLVDIVVDGVTGILVTPNDVDRLASAIAVLARDTNERERMGKAGFARLVEHFSLQQYVSGFENLYGAVGEGL